MKSTNHIARYYDQTQNHYERWWGLKHSMALHFGIWENDTRNFTEAIINTNRILANLANVVKDDHILDAGCGVGGTSIYLAIEKHASVKGITISEKQAKTARQNVKKYNLESEVEIFNMDFTNTTFDNNAFDIIWACESLSHLDNKQLFVKEAFRLLKKGGRLVIADFYRTHEQHNELLDKWTDSWAMAKLITLKNLQDVLKENGFIINENRDYSYEIIKTSRRLYLASLFGKLPSQLYNLFYKSSEYSRNHYKSGIYQYKALQQKLWKYHTMLATKR